MNSKNIKYICLSCCEIDVFEINMWLVGWFDFSLWDVECGACLRVLEGHEELVRCIRFDSKRIVSGAYDG